MNKVMRKVVLSSMIGNALEWYEYALYVQFSYIIGATFLGGQDSLVTQVITFAIFALGFIIRPAGAFIFSIIGDRLGRKAALSLSILSMAIPTGVIGILPSYSSIGVLAPLILGMMRLLQGLALGGEFSVCISYLVEHAAPRNDQRHFRGLVGSASFVSMCIGMLLGSTIAYAMNLYISQETLVGWAWRLPFIGGFMVGLLGIYLRSYISESPVYLEAKKQGLVVPLPTLEMFKEQWPNLLTGCLIYITVTAPFYALNVYVPIFMQQIMSYTAADAALVNMFGLLIMCSVMPLSALLSDKFGRRPVLLFSSVLVAVSIYPIFLLFGTSGLAATYSAQALFSVVLGMYMGPIPTVLVEMFPTNFRLVGVALSYNLSAAVFGGTLPMVAIMLRQFTGDNYSIAVYLAILSVVSFVTVLQCMQESYQKDLAA